MMMMRITRRRLFFATKPSKRAGCPVIVAEAAAREQHMSSLLVSGCDRSRRRRKPWHRARAHRKQAHFSGDPQKQEKSETGLGRSPIQDTVTCLSKPRVGSFCIDSAATAHGVDLYSLDAGSDITRP
jgi:hypothetical protein